VASQRRRIALYHEATQRNRLTSARLAGSADDVRTPLTGPRRSTDCHDPNSILKAREPWRARRSRPLARSSRGRWTRLGTESVARSLLVIGDPYDADRHRTVSQNAQGVDRQRRPLPPAPSDTEQVSDGQAAPGAGIPSGWRRLGTRTIISGQWRCVRKSRGCWHSVGCPLIGTRFPRRP
jgi:hypothetical protein